MEQISGIGQFSGLNAPSQLSGLKLNKFFTDMFLNLVELNLS